MKSDKVPAGKIMAIKRIREVTGFGLAKAKLLIENCPSENMNGMYLNQAGELCDLLKLIRRVNAPPQFNKRLGISNIEHENT